MPDEAVKDSGDQVLIAYRVVINNMMDDPDAPRRGFKFSVGCEYGRYGIGAFVGPKAILE